MAGFGSVKPKSGNKDSLKLHEVVEMHKWPDDKWSLARFLNTPIISVKRHWISIVAGKEKKIVTIPRYCLAHNILNEHEPRTIPHPKKEGKTVPAKCPYCDLVHGKEGTASARAEFFYLANAIIREIQEDEPRKKSPHTKEEAKTGFKDIRSKSWTPVRVCRITSSVVLRIQELSEGNTVKNKKTGKKEAYDITDPKYGIDIRIKYKPKGAGTDKYSADADERTPLTDDERKYLVWDLSDALIDATGRFDTAQAIEDFKRLDVVGGDTPDDSDDDDDDDGYALGGKKGKKSGKKSKPAFSDDDDDEPKKKKKAKKSIDGDDDDDDDAPKKKKKKPSFDDDDDDDDDEPKPKKKKKPAFSDDDDDEPKKKKSKKSKVEEAPKKKKKAKVEDDAPKKKKKKK